MMVGNVGVVLRLGSILDRVGAVLRACGEGPWGIGPLKAPDALTFRLTVL